MAAEHPELVSELAKVFSDKMRAWHGVMPIVVSTGKPAPLPDEI